MDISLDDYIAQKQSSERFEDARSRLSRPSMKGSSQFKNEMQTDYLSGEDGVVGDVRSHLAAKNKQKFQDAREKLSQRSNIVDARQKLNQKFAWEGTQALNSHCQVLENNIDPGFQPHPASNGSLEIPHVSQQFNWSKGAGSPQMKPLQIQIQGLGAARQPTAVRAGPHNSLPTMVSGVASYQQTNPYQWSAAAHAAAQAAAHAHQQLAVAAPPAQYRAQGLILPEQQVSQVHSLSLTAPQVSAPASLVQSEYPQQPTRKEQQYDKEMIEQGNIAQTRNLNPHSSNRHHSAHRDLLQTFRHSPREKPIPVLISKTSIDELADKHSTRSSRKAQPSFEQSVKSSGSATAHARSDRRSAKPYAQPREARRSAGARHTNSRQELKHFDSTERKALNQSAGNATPGFKVQISNLVDDVTNEDVLELFGSVGALRSARTLGPGRAEAIYVHREHAIEACKQFHSRALDGQPMRVKLVTAVEKQSTASNKNPASSKEARTRRAPAAQLGLVQKALFGVQKQAAH